MRYEKGRRGASRQKIMDVAARRFREDGIAASGLSGIMQEAGLTNGAFYPHFASKSALVRESVLSALEGQADQVGNLLRDGGVAAAIDAYLTPEHRDNPGLGCASSALLPEIAREPTDTRKLYTDRVGGLVQQLAAAIPAGAGDPKGRAWAIFSTLIGALELSRAVDDPALSRHILTAAAQAAKSLACVDETGAAHGKPS